VNLGLRGVVVVLVGRFGFRVPGRGLIRAGRFGGCNIIVDDGLYLSHWVGARRVVIADERYFRRRSGLYLASDLRAIPQADSGMRQRRIRGGLFIGAGAQQDQRHEHRQCQQISLHKITSFEFKGADWLGSLYFRVDLAFIIPRSVVRLK